jgi:hypothetical protein
LNQWNDFVFKNIIQHIWYNPTIYFCWCYVKNLHLCMLLNSFLFEFENIQNFVLNNIPFRTKTQSYGNILDLFIVNVVVYWIMWMYIHFNIMFHLVWLNMMFRMNLLFNILWNAFNIFNYRLDIVIYEWLMWFSSNCIFHMIHNLWSCFFNVWKYIHESFFL